VHGCVEHASVSLSDTSLATVAGKWPEYEALPEYVCQVKAEEAQNFGLI
jgi:hypothetical protein